MRHVSGVWVRNRALKIFKVVVDHVADFRARGSGRRSRIVDQRNSQIGVVATIRVVADGDAAPRRAVIEPDGILREVHLMDDVRNGSLFQVRQDLKHPADALLEWSVRRPFATRHSGDGRGVLQIVFNDDTRRCPAGGKHLLGVVEVVNRQADVLEIVAALGAAGRLARRLNRRQQQGHQDADDRDHDQEFDQREIRSGKSIASSCSALLRKCSSLPTVRGIASIARRGAATRASPCCHRD